MTSWLKLTIKIFAAFVLLSTYINFSFSCATAQSSVDDWRTGALKAMNSSPPIVSADAVKIYLNAHEAMLLNRYSEAEPGFKKAIDISPNFDAAYNELGLTLTSLGRPAEAVEILEKALTLTHHDSAVYGNLGAAYAQLGKTKMGLDFYQKFLILEPNDPSARQIRALVKTMREELTARPGSHLNGANDYLGDATADGVIFWREQDMPLKIYIDRSVHVLDYKPISATIFEESLKEWVTASKGKISYKLIDNPKDAQITCTWTDNPLRLHSQFDGGESVNTQSKFGISKSDIILLTHKTMDHSPMTDDESRLIDLHVIGKALGLGSSKKVGDVTHTAMAYGIKNPHLSARDKNTLLALYSLNESEIDGSEHTNDPIASADTEADESTNLCRLGAKELTDGHTAKAISILEPAHRRFPNDQAITTNLGLSYGWMGSELMHDDHLKEAQTFFNKGLVLLESCNDQHLKQPILDEYEILKQTKESAQNHQSSD